jgi:hypothetical protein
MYYECILVRVRCSSHRILDPRISIRFHWILLQTCYLASFALQEGGDLLVDDHRGGVALLATAASRPLTPASINGVDAWLLFFVLDW